MTQCVTLTLTLTVAVAHKGSGDFMHKPTSFFGFQIDSRLPCRWLMSMHCVFIRSEEEKEPQRLGKRNIMHFFDCKWHPDWGRGTTWNESRSSLAGFMVLNFHPSKGCWCGRVILLLVASFFGQFSPWHVSQSKVPHHDKLMRLWSPTADDEKCHTVWLNNNNNLAERETG